MRYCHSFLNYQSTIMHDVRRAVKIAVYTYSELSKKLRRGDTNVSKVENIIWEKAGCGNVLQRLMEKAEQHMSKRTSGKSAGSAS